MRGDDADAPFGQPVIADNAASGTFQLDEYFPSGLNLGGIAAGWRNEVNGFAVPGPLVTVFRGGLISIKSGRHDALTPTDLSEEPGEAGFGAEGEDLPTGVGLIRYLDFAQIADLPSVPQDGGELSVADDIFAPYWMEASPLPPPECENLGEEGPIPPANRVYIRVLDEVPGREVVIITFDGITPIGTECVNRHTMSNTIQLVIAADAAPPQIRPNARVQYRFGDHGGCNWSTAATDFDEGRETVYGRSGYIFSSAAHAFELLGTGISGTFRNYDYCFAGNLPKEDPETGEPDENGRRPAGTFEFLFTGSVDERLAFDDDRDGSPDDGDNCAGQANIAQDDLDRDGIGNICDRDTDGDSRLDRSDNCSVACNMESDNVDSDEMGDVCEGADAELPDLDNDGIVDLALEPDQPAAPAQPRWYFVDNCLLVPNPHQLDSNNDGIGDACSSDSVELENPYISPDGRQHQRWRGRPWWVPLGGELDREPVFVNCEQNPDGDRILGPVHEDDLTADNCPLRFNPTQLDNDGDGLGDRCDPDDDNDGTADEDDACPYAAGPQGDFDGDGTGDACDDDDDDDGLLDDTDNCPRAVNADQADLDNDAVGDACDLDVDGDDIANAEDNCPRVANADQADLDGDEIGDLCDGDVDGDSAANDADNCPDAANADQADLDADGTGDACDDDTDGDGVSDADDNCLRQQNPTQTDVDMDGEGDTCDPDDDNDGVPDDQDNCRVVANPAQEDFAGPEGRPDGVGDTCQDDADNDGHLDDADNCVNFPNNDQLDTDGDGAGDACDEDDDNDEVLDDADNCVLVSNADQSNVDGDDEGDICDDDDDEDGFVDVLDNCPTDANDDQVDIDDDGLGDACDDDDDADGVIDDDDNCVHVPNPEQLNADGDADGDECDINDDNDLLADVEDNCPQVPNSDQLDTDEDGAGDACDDDDDADGVLDVDDNCQLASNADQLDTDEDGTGDACDDTPFGVDMFVPDMAIEPDAGAADMGVELDASLRDDAQIITRPDMFADAQGDDMKLPLAEPPPTNAGETGCRSAPGGGLSGLWALLAMGLVVRRRWLGLAVMLVAGSAQAYEPRVDLEPYDGTEVVINPGLLLRELPNAERIDLEYVPALVGFANINLLPAFPVGLAFGSAQLDAIQVAKYGAVGVPAEHRENLIVISNQEHDKDFLFELEEQSIALWNGSHEAYTRHPWQGPEDGDVYALVGTEDENRPGRFVATWEFVHPYRTVPDDRFNDFQIIFTHVGDGDADIELRYARCDWVAARNGNSLTLPYALMAININEGPDGVQQQWAYPGSSSDEMRRLCLLSNTGTPGVWRYQLRDGQISGCGLPFNGYVPEEGRCFDGNPNPGDGCSSDCRVEPDVDGDGRREPPPDGMTNVDGTPYDPLRVYDYCLFDACIEFDRDLDGVFDDEDNCPDTANAPPLNNGPRAQLDFDGDGRGDACDSDDDNDGIRDVDDSCPLGFDLLNHRGAPFGPNGEPGLIQPDSDGDGLAEYCDPDDDNDGVPDCGDDGICPFPYDGLYNGSSFDFAFADLPDEVVVRFRDQYDNDSDGIIDERSEDEGGGAPVRWSRRDVNEDNCRTIPNPDQANADGDLFGDACDPDADGDGVSNCGDDGWCAYLLDLKDNDEDGLVDEAGECDAGEAPCLPQFDNVDNDLDQYIDERPGVVYAEGPALESTEDGAARTIAPVDDADLDDGQDNCLLHANHEQLDADGDGVGDACDDDDGDGVFLSEADRFGNTGGPLDNCPDTPNADQADADGDGLGDACDPDDDGDGVDDAEDVCPGLSNPDQSDLDADGLGDACDDDDDGDDVPDDIDNCQSVPNSGQGDANEDGVGDACQVDDDADGVADNVDNCPLTANPEQADLDSDGFGDACDEDDDADGVPDFEDNCPNSFGFPADQSDHDGDAMGDVCDDDDDNDGLVDAGDNCPFLRTDQDEPDFDMDGSGDACDDDDDNDGVVDGDDNCPNTLGGDAEQADLDEDGEGDVCDRDDDGDGFEDLIDLCPRVPRPIDRQGQQRDADGDGIGDDCDDDDDNDGVFDDADNCPVDANVDQVDTDRDGLGDSCDPDIDGDEVHNDDDNCPLTVNPEQGNVDLDDDGDACDDDIDQDMVANELDNCPSVRNPDQADNDRDRRGDACDDDDDNDGVADDVDICPMDADPMQLNTDQTDDGGDACDEDDDGDGIEDGADNCPLVPNPNQENLFDAGPGDACDDDDDGDGVLDVDDNCPRAVNADQADFNGNQVGDACDDDDDGDGIDDRADNCPLVPNPQQENLFDTGPGDACDDDDDGDGVLDVDDNCPRVVNADQADFNSNRSGDACTDTDGDGILDAVDNCKTISNRDQSNVDGDDMGDLCDDDYNPDETLVDECRDRTSPLLWAEECDGQTQKIGCAAAPGSGDGSSGVWWLLGLVLLRRRTR